MNGEKREEMTGFNFFVANMSKDGTSTANVGQRIAMATSANARLSRLWTRLVS
ncbi:hypothetical protein DPMN_067273 [Dreissena polymorpha]|uniref:Uncharacterized protein n=1 Tax=Dreissena polymorpha TaxID=45954 RepID=A0A9D4BSP3_DREPO|nr:hypothetical protein DPMN_067273 [Dreissena polymorpha]